MMRSQNLLNEKEQTLWNSARDMVIYHYQNYNLYSSQRNSNNHK